MTRHFSLHAMIDDEQVMPALFETIVGMPISYKALYVGKWTMRRLLSDRYASKRAFLAGDSAHLNGGLGRFAFIVGRRRFFMASLSVARVPIGGCGRDTKNTGKLPPLHDRPRFGKRYRIGLAHLEGLCYLLLISR